MKTCLPRGLFLAIVSCLLFASTNCVAQSAAEPRLESGGLKILRAVVLHLRDDYSDMGTLRLSLVVQNVSEAEITVLTAHTGVTIMNYEAPLYQMGLDSEARYGGVILVPSIYQFDPVTLRPSEGTTITVDYPFTSRSQFMKNVVSVGYTITPLLAERLNLWQGTLISEPVKVQSAMRRPPTYEEIQELRRRSATIQQKPAGE